MATPGIPGFEEISNLATKYSPEQLQRMAASGMIDVAMATRAKFLQQRIASEVAKSQMPTTTVAQDVMAPPQPAAPQGLPAAQQMAAQPTASGLDALPVNEAEYAGGGIVAFAEGGTPYDRQIMQDPYDPALLGQPTDEEAMTGNFVPEALKRAFLYSSDVEAGKKKAEEAAAARLPELDADPLGAGDIPEAKAPTPKESVADAAKTVKEAKKTVEKAEDYLAKRKRMLKEAGVSEDMDKADREELARLRGETTKDRDEAAAMAMIKAGLGIAGGKSQYALQNIGQGAQGAVTDYAKALRDIKADEKEYAKIERDLNKAADMRKRGEVDKAIELEEKAKDREVRLRGVAAQEKQATKPSTFQEQYDLYAKGEIAAGRKPSYEGFRKAYGSQDETADLNKLRFADAALSNNMQYLALANSKKPEDQAKAQKIKEAVYARYGVIPQGGASGAPADISDLLNKYK